ncbi:hypothetical protein BD770DRAFT_375638 [Pilaira anomala]|nr:hypothetical protein BD770DRAFT_375638 [Pilaira anomala]
MIRVLFLVNIVNTTYVTALTFYIYDDFKSLFKNFFYQYHTISFFMMMSCIL